jgi:hypothetical protein
MNKGQVLAPANYLKCQKVAEGKYIQNVIVTRKPDMSWIGINNIPLTQSR